MHLSINRKRSTAVVALVLALCCCLVALPTRAYAEPASTDESIAAKKAEASRIKGQLDDLQRQVETSGDSLLELQQQIADTKLQIQETQEQIDATSAELENAQQALSVRVSANYKAGSVSMIEVLFDADSFEDFVSRYHYVASLQDRDAQMIGYSKTLKDQLAEQQTSLDQRLKEQQELEATASVRHNELEGALGQQQAILNNITSDIAGLIQKQRAEEEAQAKAEVLAQESAAKEQSQKQSEQATATTETGSSSATPDKPATGSQPTPNASQNTGKTTTPSTPSPVQPTPAPAPSVKPTKPEPTPKPSATQGTARPQIVTIAKKHLGKPYEWAAEGPNTFDCSGLTMSVYREAGFSLPRTSGQQYLTIKNRGNLVTSTSQLKPGDLVFFGKKGVHHVGIWIGGGQYLHAPRTGDVVKIAYMPLNDFVGGGSL